MSILCGRFVVNEPDLSRLTQPPPHFERFALNGSRPEHPRSAFRPTYAGANVGPAEALRGGPWNPTSAKTRQIWGTRRLVQGAEQKSVMNPVVLHFAAFVPNCLEKNSTVASSACNQLARRRKP